MSMYWFILYQLIIDDGKLRFLAIEDGWHFGEIL